MIAAAVGVLTASLLGSVHCAAMCSGFVCLYASPSTADAKPLRSHALYNIGRLLSYALLGAIAGALGAGVTRLGTFAGIGRGATIAAGILMIAWSASVIAAQQGIHLPGIRSAVPEWWQRALGRMLYALREQSTATRALLTGLGTTLLPCGWLYVFVATAGGSGSARDGVLVMTLFWLGTLPAMIAVGVGAQRLVGPLRRRMPTLGAVTVLLMGLLAVSGRLSMSAQHHAAQTEPAAAAGASHEH